jgi:hypothetical protein
VRRTLVVLLSLFLCTSLVAPDVVAERRDGHRKRRDVDAAYVARIYDYTTTASDAVRWAARYYDRVLAPHVEVRYFRMSPLSHEECEATQTPLAGIRACQWHVPDATAGSSGASWKSQNGQWELASDIYFHLPDEFWTAEGGLWGRYMTCHELGHSFCLSHSKRKTDPNCMSDLGAYTWDYLTPAQVRRIASRLPGADRTKERRNERRG